MEKAIENRDSTRQRSSRESTFIQHRTLQREFSIFLRHNHSKRQDLRSVFKDTRPQTTHKVKHPEEPCSASETVKMVYVRQDKLPGLKEYKYSGVDHSLVSRYILKPFYTNVVIKCFPMSMAPNLITLTGFMFVVVNFWTLLWYNPTLDQDCPTWVYYSWAIGLFLYQTFDAVDGSQA